MRSASSPKARASGPPPSSTSTTTSTAPNSATSKQEYLHLAQQLRDAPPGGPILEARRPDGEFSRFDKRNGYFGAYNRDHTIRTFFIPNDGERYFWRQARRPH